MATPTVVVECATHQVLKLPPPHRGLLVQHRVGQHVERGLHDLQHLLQRLKVLVSRLVDGLQGQVHTLGPGDLRGQHHQLGLELVHPEEVGVLVNGGRLELVHLVDGLSQQAGQRHPHLLLHHCQPLIDLTVFDQDWREELHLKRDKY